MPDASAENSLYRVASYGDLEVRTLHEMQAA
jgi:hypothetical protein